MKIKLNLILASFLSWCILGCSIPKEYRPVKYPKNYKGQIDVIYKTVGNWEGRIDLYTDTTSVTPTPIVLNIHGGGWSHGKKESQTGFGSFFKNGYAVANVAYRLVDVSPAPAAIEDVRCALIYLHSNAEALNIDTSKIVIRGTSAGGHLALMAGLLGNNTTFDTDCSYTGNLQVATIVDIYGITDLVSVANMSSKKRWLDKKFEDKAFIESVSPINYVSEDSPPVFIVHGDNDQLVPYSQSEKLYNTLQKHNISSDFLTLKNAGHGNLNKEQQNLINIRMWSFLKSLNLSKF